jgi:hypothetical protein
MMGTRNYFTAFPITASPDLLINDLLKAIDVSQLSSLNCENLLMKKRNKAI